MGLCCEWWAPGQCGPFGGSVSGLKVLNPGWVRTHLASGSVNAFATLAMVLVRGLLAFTVLGTLAAPVGITAGLSAVIAGGLVYLALSKCVSPAVAPSSAAALLLADLVTKIARDPLWALATPEGLAGLLAVVAVCVVLMGGFQIVFGLAGLGRLAQFVPQPVLAGFMNGVAILIVLSQVPALLGLASLTSLRSLMDETVWSHIQPLALVLGLCTAGSAWAVRHWRPHLPPSLVALVAGSALYAALMAMAPLVQLGPTVGSLAAGKVLSVALLPITAANAFELLWRHSSAVVVTAGVLAVVTSLESLLAAASIGQITQTRHDSRRELLALGMANMVGGALGGVPLTLSLTRVLSMTGNEVCSRKAIAWSTGLVALVYALGSPWLARLPVAVLAGIMLTMAAAVADRWTRQLLTQLRSGDRSPELSQSLQVVALVCCVIVAMGFAAGVAAGVLLSMVLFIQSMNQSLVRRRFDACQRPSRRIYARDQELLLHAARNKIIVLELEGALFFGSTQRLNEEADAVVGSCGHLILDMQRVSMIDASGAMLLEQLSRHLGERGVTLLLAGVSAQNPHGQRLRAYGCFRGSCRDDWWPDLDHAIEAAEQKLLQDAGVTEPQAALALTQTFLMRGLATDQRAQLSQRMVEQHVTAGSFLFRQGDPGDRLYVLTQGSISIVGGSEQQPQRYVSYSPGVMFGEIAMLDGGGRTADAIADSAVVVWVLTGAALDALAGEQPVLGERLMRNVATNLAERLRNAPSV